MDGEFISDRYASLWVTHHFDGFILDKIPLISKLQLRSVAAVKVLYGTLEPSNESIYEMPEGTTGLNELYLEAGVGVENILKLFRVDFYFRVTQRDKADINKWGVKIYLAPRI